MTGSNFGPLEHLAAGIGNLVRYDAAEVPGIFVPVPQAMSSDLAANLPTHVHPAFVRGTETQNCVLIGKYECCAVGDGLYPLANMPPASGIGHDDGLARMRAFGYGAGGMTIAEHGLMVLLAHKRGHNPGGNNAYGADHGDGTAWQWAENPDAGDKYTFGGHVYECLSPHMTGADNMPAFLPDFLRGADWRGAAYWKESGFVGGVHAQDAAYEPDGRRGRTLTGSGPAAWYTGGDVRGLCDENGNVSEAVYGVRVVGGEIQILGDDNFAADPEADLSANGAWKAILPGTGGDYTLVEPGTAGTVHYDYTGGALSLTDAAPAELPGKSYGCAFAALAIRLASVPSILYELGLAPISGTNVEGRITVTLTENECLAWRGGDYTDGEHAGIACIKFLPGRGIPDDGRDNPEDRYGLRMRMDY